VIKGRQDNKAKPGKPGKRVKKAGRDERARPDKPDSKAIPARRDRLRHVRQESIALPTPKQEQCAASGIKMSLLDCC
jgi:hypothetical protein